MSGHTAITIFMFLTSESKKKKSSEKHEHIPKIVYYLVIWKLYTKVFLTAV